MSRVSQSDQLTEPVRQSRLQTSLHHDGQNWCTIQTSAVPHQTKPKREVWVHYSGFFLQFYGWWDTPGWMHISMEYCKLGDLGSYLKNAQLCPNSLLSEDQVHEIASQVLGALSLMHSENFAHRDLKPANILIDKQPPDHWSIKLCDFGLSKPIDQTTSLGIRGTPGFLPPELLGYTVDPKSTDPCLGDIWCLGELIFLTLTGKLSAYCNIKSQTLRDSQASEPAIEFVMALMQVDPSKRSSAQKASTHRWMQRESEAQVPKSLDEAKSGSELSSDMPFWLQSNAISEPSAQWTDTGIEHPLVPFDTRNSIRVSRSTEVLPTANSQPGMRVSTAGDAVSNTPYTKPPIRFSASLNQHAAVLPLKGLVFSSQYQEQDTLASWTSTERGPSFDTPSRNFKAGSSTPAHTSDETVTQLIIPSRPQTTLPTEKTSILSTFDRRSPLPPGRLQIPIDIRHRSTRIQTFESLNSGGSKVKFSPDGNLIVTSCEKKSVILGADAHGKFKPQQELPGSVSGIGINRRYLVSCPYGKSLVTWKVDGQHGFREVRRVRLDEDNEIKLSGSGKFVALVGYVGFHIWRANSQGRFRKVQSEERAMILDIVFSPDGQQFAKIESDGLAVGLYTNNEGHFWRSQMYVDLGRPRAFSPDGQWLVTEDVQNDIIYLNKIEPSGSWNRMTLHEASSVGFPPVFSSDSMRLAIYRFGRSRIRGEENRISVWQRSAQPSDTWDVLLELKIWDKWVTAFDHSPNGRQIAFLSTLIRVHGLHRPQTINLRSSTFNRWGRLEEKRGELSSALSLFVCIQSTYLSSL
ncbi:hypothetical protein B0J13DRAFT_600777 [Dactylonectria estremocensis]|uniref:non-specific serine/threonine protein kinase n=1 Tax=Dactylonectria estremocensis TaxID=1079267 RepID=A0A9P9JHV6_9HYPO|nr:hypothetical protein B0J13DRAFT_600777 [Dactylonectria estremocensis]